MDGVTVHAQFVRNLARRFGIIFNDENGSHVHRRSGHCPESSPLIANGTDAAHVTSASRGGPHSAQRARSQAATMPLDFLRGIA
ncbi:hypothetical protein [Novosphingobium sp. EMRT-2]|uniref:hypothetical protein n=1 Tax=Novosphingobium sp. EMRT-2 TaxID=2571749 RepID=UPI00143DD9BF|nr:hypothetical protein [Novosphingobium sp. EMRT-2]